MNFRIKTGLGDAVEQVTKATGIKKVVDVISEATGVDCGCDTRKEWLNEKGRQLMAWWNHKEPQCMTEEQSQQWEAHRPNGNAITPIQQEVIFSLHDSLFGVQHPRPSPGCSKCWELWKQWIEEIEFMYKNRNIK